MKKIKKFYTLFLAIMLCICSVKIAKAADDSNKILKIEFSGSIAKVQLRTAQNADLVVAVYDDQNCTQMLASGKTSVTSNTKTAEVTVKTQNIPQHFTARAFLLQKNDLKPLCESYTTEISSSSPSDVKASGVDGNISWKFTYDGTLYINGTGKMPNYGYMYSSSQKRYVTVPAPWEDLKDNIKKVVVEEGILNIGANAFSNCERLEEIVLPSDLSVIKDAAFSNCTRLKKITLPEKLQTLEGGNVFARCESLERIVLPSRITKIPDQTFLGCTSLKEIVLPENLEGIGEYAFGDCTALESIEFPESFDGTGRYAFSGCTSLKNITFEPRQASMGYPAIHIGLGQGSFSGCSSLESVTLTGLQSLSSEVFGYCGNLKEIHFTDKKPTFNEGAFWGLDHVTVYYPGSDPTWDGIETESFKGTNIVWKASDLSVAAQESEAVSSDMPEDDFDDGQSVETDVSPEITDEILAEEDMEQPEELEPDDEQEPDAEDPELIVQTIEPSVVNAQESKKSSSSTSAYNDREPGSYSLFIVVKSKNVSDILNADNLLYIDQQTADKTGFVSFMYKINGESGNPVSCIFGNSVHKHSYGKWNTVKKATVFAPEVRQRKCSICGNVEKKNFGSKIKPVIEVSALSVVLQTGQATNGLKVTKTAAGDSGVSWKSENTKIVKVSSTGRLVAQKKTGKTFVTVKLKSGLTKKITVKVQKEAVKTQKISGLKKNLVIKRGNEITLKPVRQPFTSLEKISYTSSDKKTVSVTNKGTLKGLKKGKARIIVRCGGKSYTISVTVK